MVVRSLPRADWPRLIGTELERAVPYLPEDAEVLVVEDAAGAIVGCWAVIRYVHVEGLWIHPDHRKRGRVGAHLWRAMVEAARALGAGAVLTGAIDDQVRRLIAHAGGTKLPGDCYVLPLGRHKCRS